MPDRLAVLLSDEVVGYLEREEPGTPPTFSYAPAYLRTGAVALSARLPLQSGPHPARRVAPYLFGLLPENGAARTAWAEQLGVGQDDAFGILAAMGWDCPGAVQFCHEDQLDELRARRGDLVPVSDADIADRIRAFARAEPSWTMPGEHWSLGGQQEKFALTREGDQWHAAHGSAPTTHIVKPGIRQLHHQALVEHATQDAASRLGVSMTTSAFTRFEDQWAIVVERFDRFPFEGHVVRVHQEDFAQACGRMPASKYESRGGPTLADMERIVSRESTDVPADRLALADFAIVNLVAGAPDGHAKNISLLRGPGFTGVAPLYDLATGLTYDARDVERTVALSIGGERSVSRIRRHQWERTARTLHLDPALLLARVRSLARGFPSAFESALAELPAGTPGVDEVATRSIPALRAHTRQVLDRLP